MADVNRLFKKISPNPLVNTTVEVRFTPSKEISHDEVFNIFFPSFSKLYPKMKPAPNALLNQPNSLIKISNPNLIFYADVIFSNDEYTAALGNNGISFENLGTYHFWDNFFSNIKQGLEILSSLNIIASIDRIGLRYGSIFEQRTSVEGTFDINLKYEDYTQNVHTLQTEYTKENIRLLLQIYKLGQQIRDGKPHIGTYIDIDATMLSNIPQSINDELFKAIDLLHTEEKKLFVSLLNNNFLATLNPEY